MEYDFLFMISVIYDGTAPAKLNWQRKSEYLTICDMYVCKANIINSE